MRKLVDKLNEHKKLVLVLCILLLVSSFSIAYGRYAYYGVRNFYLATKNFYFNSDKLKDVGQNYQIDNWSGVQDYVIVFNMNSYKNNKVFASEIITYDISFTCSNNITCQASKTEGVIDTSSHIDSFSITVTPVSQLDTGDVVWVEVTASATEPYTKTLSGRVSIKVGQTGFSYDISDVENRTYFDVNLTNTRDFYIIEEAFSRYSVNNEIDIDTYLDLSDSNKDKCYSSIVTINFDPSEVILDMTTPAALRMFDIGTTLIDGYNYISTFSFKMDAISSESVRFYKRVTANNYTYPFENATSIVNVNFR